MAKKQRTAAQHERHLNQLFKDSYSPADAEAQFIYLTVDGRAGGHCRLSTLRAAIHNGTLGTLLRKYDSIAFHVSKND